ncbi:hypothetical protein [Rhodoferax sp. PAMC 29310]|uniref:FFLEELY motif protein n=1 Tax=Rhodoferax sp. PAMC 29310 TaxID=2822760 RepID=UPI001B31C196|nr:hypothetical protein [Rhodoferax sp. PAMC 29310]
MDAKTIIRSAVDRVEALRQAATGLPGLAHAVSEIKHLQARRFEGTYADLLAAPRYRPAALFFLNELYSDKDYTERDAQFSRIAGALERIFPEQVIHTAVSLAQLHSLTEELDFAMAEHWLGHPSGSDAARYIAAWRDVGRRSDRSQQLASTLEVGAELDRLTRKPGLRTMLRMMRRPAQIAGLGSLQQFLEAGFDTFATMGKQSNAVTHFLELVDTRESTLMDQFFNGPSVSCETEITSLLGEPR